MARIIVKSGICTVDLTDPDSDGDYGWFAECGEASDTVRPIDEAIANAETHVDISCPRLAKS